LKSGELKEANDSILALMMHLNQR